MERSKNFALSLAYRRITERHTNVAAGRFVPASGMAWGEPPGPVKAFDPRNTAAKNAKADVAIEYAKRAKDWPTLGGAGGPPA